MLSYPDYTDDSIAHNRKKENNSLKNANLFTLIPKKLNVSPVYIKKREHFDKSWRKSHICIKTADYTRKTSVMPSI